MDGKFTSIPGGAAPASSLTRTRLGWVVGCRRGDDRSDAADLARLQARGADVHPLTVARAVAGVHHLDVRVPPAVGATVGVRHRLAETGALRAHVTHGRHDEQLLEVLYDDPARAVPAPGRTVTSCAQGSPAGRTRGSAGRWARRWTRRARRLPGVGAG